MEKFAIGVLIGVVGGALLTANNYKMRKLVLKGQEEVQEKLDKLMSKKLRDMDEKEDDTDEREEKLAKKLKK